ncbi:carbonate dehydratase, eukaryotic-type [Ostertagia ostertagi]
MSQKRVNTSPLFQSPIDIRASDVDYALLHQMQFVHYDHSGTVNVINNGHTAFIQGGYNISLLLTFHFHWAQYDHQGSEHKIGGLHYPAELHLVHVRQGIELQEALKRPDGIAVVGVFLVIGHDDAPLSLYSVFESVTHYAHTEAFYRYEGSLTTPNCDEAVIWTVLAEPITIAPLQMKQLRQIHASDGERHSLNFRPAQPLNERRLLYRPTSFDKKLFCGGGEELTILTSVLIGFLCFLL